MREKQVASYLESLDEDYSFHGFKSWVRKNHPINITDLTSTDEIDVLLTKYGEVRNKGSFESMYEVKYETFRGWLIYNYKETIGQIRKDKKLLNERLKEYKAIQMMHVMSKSTLYSTIQKLMYDEPLEENEYFVYDFIRKQEEETYA